jgi:CBS domain-containing protein
LKRRAVDFLRNVPPFSALPENERSRIASQLIPEKHPADTVLYHQGQSGVDRVLIIEKGYCELYFDKQDKIILKAFLGEGDIFGGISILMNGGLSLRTVRTLRETDIYVLKKNEFLEICDHHETVRAFFTDAFNRSMKDESYASLITAGQGLLLLSGVVPFTFLPEDERERIARELTLSFHPKGTILFIQGHTPVEHLLVIQKGAAEQYIEENHRKTQHGYLGEGDIYGGISILLNNGVSIRTVEVLEDSCFFLLEKKPFLDLCGRYPAFSEFFTDMFGKRMLDRSYAAGIARTFQEENQTLQMFNQPVGGIASYKLIFCDTDTSVRRAAVVMSENKCSSILVKEASGSFVGLVTDNDLRNKVIAGDYDVRKPVAGIMSTPLRTISSQALVFEALLTMNQNAIKHLAVTDADECVVGIVTNRDLIVAQGETPFFLIREIRDARSVDDVAARQKDLPRSIQSLIKNGAKPRNITRLVTAVSDAVLSKIVGFAEAEMGPPPIRYAFMILGSDGRKEQTLKTDQDNALIYEDVDPEREAEVRPYFLEFSTKICGWLDQCGYAFCTGGVMAKNPNWCQSLATWKGYFAEWINKADPEDLLQAGIFFDFRHGAGDSTLVRELRRSLRGSLGSWAGFFRSLTENALHFKPPLGFFRNFVVESKGEHKNKFDIKSAMLPLVDLARIYSLKHDIEETNTQERYHQVYLKKGISEQDYSELETAYSFLMQLRLVRQITAILDEKTTPDNYINPKKLSRIEQTMLKEIFQRIEKFQSALSLEFTGTT